MSFFPLSVFLHSHHRSFNRGRHHYFSSATMQSAEVLRQTTSFLNEVISQQGLRHKLFQSFYKRFNLSDQNSNLKPLKLAAETLDNAIPSTNTSIRISSIQLSEQLLLSYPDNSFSSFLLSIIYTLSDRPIDAALSLLDVFLFGPLLSRTDIAPDLFEKLFLTHVLPALQGFNDRRLKILSSLTDKSLSSEFINESIVIPSSKSLSKMSGNQAIELKQLEKDYEMVLDENCKAFALHLKEVLRNQDGRKLMKSPTLVLTKMEDQKEEEVHYVNEMIEEDKEEDFPFMNGRYNPMWGDEDRSVEFCSISTPTSSSNSTKSKSLPFFPGRVSFNTLINKQKPKTLRSSLNVNADAAQDAASDDNISDTSSSDSEDEKQDKISKMSLLEHGKNENGKLKNTLSAESSSSPNFLMADSSSLFDGGKHTPPKEFVCPITSHLFDDPVTLETGQTYERKAIQEWIERGYSTCPITRQKLQSTQLPKTNYVLKRLIASWQEEHPGSVVIEYGNTLPEPDPTYNPRMPSASPNSVISQASMEGTVRELHHTIANLCTSEILKESEMAVLWIKRFWMETNMDVEIQTMLSKPPVINGFVEILFNSIDAKVLKETVFLLSELGSRDKFVIQTLTQVDSDVDGIVALFKKGLLEAVVLIYLLGPSTSDLVEMDVVESLVTVLERKHDAFLEMCMKPKAAAVLLLGQIFGSNADNISSSAKAVVEGRVMEDIIGSLEAELPEERMSAVRILLRCIQEDGKSRNIIADRAQLAPVLESFVRASDSDQFEIIQFLSELVKLNRRTFNEQVLHIIKDEGTFSTMHTLLVYLQTAPQIQCPMVAGLLLQLDLLEEPRKMSIYREEAINTLISCLQNTENPDSQIEAAETIVLLQGRFCSSGKPLSRALLLKRAGLRKSYKSSMQMEQLSKVSAEAEEKVDEEKAADEWERKMAFVLVSHEFGLLFEALSECLKSKYAELCSACFVSATWLVHMLAILPDTGIRGAARVCLLKRFVSIFKSAKDIEDKTLTLLALNSFIKDSEGLRDIVPYLRDILKGLREIRKSSPLAIEMLKVLSKGNESSVELWNHKELVQVDCSKNGEVLSIICFKDKIFSGHTDGTIKVWSGRGSILHFIQEIQEHAKAVTSLAVLHSGEKLYSGSLDKTARVWSISNERIHCVQVHDMNDQVTNLVVAKSISCFIPQGAGVKVHSWNGGSKLMNANKTLKCIALVQSKLYCGCGDSSIQEIDLATGTTSTIQHGSRKLLAKSNPIYAIQVYDGLVYSASSPLDGASVKIWNASNYNAIGSVPSTLEVRAMVVSSELIYLGCKGGLVEIWGRQKLNRVETLQIVGTSSKINCMSLDSDEEILVIGTSDGKIQAWGLN